MGARVVSAASSYYYLHLQAVFFGTAREPVERGRVRFVGIVQDCVDLHHRRWFRQSCHCEDNHLRIQTLGKLHCNFDGLLGLQRIIEANEQLAKAGVVSCIHSPPPTRIAFYNARYKKRIISKNPSTYAT